MKNLLFLAFAAIVLAGCGKYDDSAINRRVDDLEKRVTTLERAVAALDEQLKAGSLVKSVTEITKAPGGWRIEFVGGKLSVVEIMNGKDGAGGTNGTNGTNGDSLLSGITPNPDGTVTFTLAGGGSYTFAQAASGITRIEVMTTGKVVIAEGLTADIRFRVNPSGAIVPTLASAWKLDLIGPATRASYVNETSPLSVEGVAKDGDLTGQYVATIRCGAFDPEISEYVVALVLNVGGELITSGTFRLGAVSSKINGIDVVEISAGTFLMGSSDGSNWPDYTSGADYLNTTPAEPNRDNGYETQHRVTLTQGFHMSKFQITNAQYADFLNEKGVVSEEQLHNPIWGSMSGGGKCTWGDNNGKVMIFDGADTDYDYGLNWDAANSEWVPAAGYEDHPVIWVTWYGADEYARYVGGALPTEAQWEYAARGGQTESLPFGIGTGRKLTGDMANFYSIRPYDLDATPTPGSYYDETQDVYYYRRTTAAGHYPYANGYGLYDMHGNVYEWCSDWFESNYGSAAASDPATDPTGGVDTGNSFRALRGGAWHKSAWSCRSASRGGDNPGGAYLSFGFRVVFP